MIEIALVLVILLFCVLGSETYILYLLFFLLPFHTFIKSCLFYFQGGGNIFASWKELAILILCWKVFSKPHFKIDQRLLFFILIFVAFTVIFFFFSEHPKDALATLRDHLSPILLLLALGSLPLTVQNIRVAILFFCVAILINCVMGFLQNFFYNIQISTLMGSIDFIDESGYVKYNSNSARILGFERMSGILGGANIFGLFYSFVNVFLFGVLIYSRRLGFTKVVTRLIVFLLFLSTLCLLFSFSRAGWVIAAVGTVVLLRISQIKIPLRYYVIGTIVLIGLLAITVTFFPYVGDIFYRSVTGKEASAADRSNNFNTALSANLADPFGHALGTTDHRYDYEFFSESAFMNITYEMGFLGLVALLLVHWLFIKTIYKYRKEGFRPFSNVALSITIPTLIVCFVSVNPYGMPFIYLWWMILGLGLNKSDFIPSIS
jgi:hypothetical protein